MLDDNIDGLSTRLCGVFQPEPRSCEGDANGDTLKPQHVTQFERIACFVVVVECNIVTRKGPSLSMCHLSARRSSPLGDVELQTCHVCWRGAWTVTLIRDTLSCSSAV